MKSVVGGVILALACLLLPAPAFAEFSILFYVGKQFTANGSLHFTRGDTDLTFSDVSWRDKSFTPPIFYGVRASYWFPDMRQWGVAVDFTHAKTILREQERVPVRGVREGVPVDAREPIADTIERFELTHGLNLVTFNGLHRWFPVGSTDPPRFNSLQCYTGLGAGFSVPHVEAHLRDRKTGREESTGRYQIAAGPVLNLLAGVNYDFSNVMSAVAEYKLSYSDVHAKLNGGGRIETRTFNHQLISGLAGNVTP